MPDTDLIELRNGPVVQAAAIRLGIALEARGHVLTAHGTALHVTNAAALTSEDRAAITALRRHLVACVTYSPPEGA